MTIGLCIAFLFALYPSDLDAHRNVGKAAIGAALLAFFQLCFWLLWHRHREGRAIAAAVGLLLTQPVVAAMLLPQVREQTLDMAIIVFFSYLAASQFLWAVAIKPIWPKRATDL
jgi:hypothetical protein